MHRRGGWQLALRSSFLSTSHPCIARARTPFQLGKAKSRADGAEHVLEFTTVAAKIYDIISQR